jgi:hypothetical protein
VTVVGGRLQTAHWWAKDDGRRKLSGKVRLKHARSVRVQRVSAGAGVRGCDHNAYMDGAEYTESECRGAVAEDREVDFSIALVRGACGASRAPMAACSDRRRAAVPALLVHAARRSRSKSKSKPTTSSSAGGGGVDARAPS